MDTHEGLLRTTPPFSFVVLSDAHFRSASRGDAPGPSRAAPRPLETEAYAENVDVALAPMMQSLKQDPPAFIVVTGDLVEVPPTLEEARSEMEACLAFFSSHHIPFLVARGNLDSEEAYDSVVMPHLQTLLGQRLSERYYSVDVGGSRIVVLDTTAWGTAGAQSMWLQALLDESQAAGVQRLFLFGHHPIWAPINWSTGWKEVRCNIALWLCV